MSTCIEQGYYDLTTNSPAVIILPAIVVLSCSVYSSDVNIITKKTLVVVSVVFMAPYFPDSISVAILSLITSRKTWCISSNASKGVDFCDNQIMLQLLKEPNTSQ